MGLKTEWVRFDEYSGYLALPEQANQPLPAVIVIQEVGGVNENIEDITRRIASAGYAALAPDLFALKGERLPAFTPARIAETFAFLQKQPPAVWGDAEARNTALNALPEADRARIGETFGKIFGSASQLDGFMPHLKSAAHYLTATRPETAGQKLGCVGFCMGGGLSALLACEEPLLAGAAVYYGSTPSPEKIANVSCPVIAFYGENDQRVNTGIPAFVEGMQKAHKPFEHYLYPGANHAFFNDTSPVYNVKAARDSFAKLLSFFLKTLAG